MPRKKSAKAMLEESRELLTDMRNGYVADDETASLPLRVRRHVLVVLEDTLGLHEGKEYSVTKEYRELRATVKRAATPNP